jgi:hypothetical protein
MSYVGTEDGHSDGFANARNERPKSRKRAVKLRMRKFHFRPVLARVSGEFKRGLREESGEIGTGKIINSITVHATC